MAYYGSGYYQSSDHGEYHQTSYAHNFNDFNSDQDSVVYSANDEPSIYNLFDYNIPNSYNYSANSSNHAYNHTPSWSPSIITTAYSVFTSSEPKSIQYYDPTPHHYLIAYNHRPQTEFAISYNSVSIPEFNIPEFDDYDPTPYDGGYDISQTYGKPLPASDETCYPRSTTATKAPSSFNDEAAKEKERTKPNDVKAEEEEKGSRENGHGDHEIINNPETEFEKSTDHEQSGLVTTTQIPSGYGLEAMDLCESLFGYWPCLSLYSGRSAINACHDNSGFYDGIICGNQWNGAADYLFGTSDPYVEKRDGGGSFGQPIHCYQRHYQKTPLFMQVEPDEDSWSQNFKSF
ncbi:hypothetical protein PanWU01x14_333140 [Parasponia andersonii]|uniref:Uncharacterized protein n=1 Tax=Parasponia andersonii TaxID=3476 RepID=A0A2P5AH27_PARAD|nr:hypothetical protein PanWU01x14_333140 [Parasponia andersonii]